MPRTGGSASGSLGILGIINISDITHSFDHAKLISHLIYGKSRDLPKLLKYFNGTTTSASSIFLLFGMLSLLILSYIQKICNVGRMVNILDVNV